MKSLDLESGEQVRDFCREAIGKYHSQVNEILPEIRSDDNSTLI
jgi:hypothetical protein